jgi:protoheme IX farnesyltransferase
MLPFLMGVNGLVYLIGAVLLGATFLCYALMMWYTKSPQWAIKTFVFSIVYLLLLFFFLLFDRYLPFLPEQIAAIG